MQLQTNVMLSITKKMKNPEVRHLFTADKIEIRRMKVQYYPNKKMWDGLLNKSKQGAAFR